MSLCTRTAAWEFCALPKRDEQVLLGCVSYHPTVGEIWEGMRSYLISEGVPFDFILFTNYEQQVAALLNGTIDIAWNGPIAHALSYDAADCVSLGMRDKDRDFPSVCVARRDSGIESPEDLRGKTVATGASDSPQGYLIPMLWLREMSVEPGEVVSFDIDLGKHGDTAIGEIKALEALVKGDVEAAVLSEMMYEFALNGDFPEICKDELKKLVDVVPGPSPYVFDHCQFDALAPSHPACPDPTGWKAKAFSETIFNMDMANPVHCKVMKLEGINNCWMPHREEGYEVTRRALAASTTRPQVPLTNRGGKFPPGSRSFSSWNNGSMRRSRFQARQGRRYFSTTTRENAKGRKVGVIGGGVAGLQAIRALRAKGFDVTLFEKSPDIGGVWRENYYNFGVQVPKQLFEFLDFPNPSPVGHFPTGPEIQTYIKDYVSKFALGDAVQTETVVESVQQLDDGAWEFTTQSESGRSVERFDFCVVATGLYSADNKFIPEIEGDTTFAGDIMHSSDFRSEAQVDGKNVVVLGNGKSAVDCAVEAAKMSGTKSVTLLGRHPHWPTPRKIANLIPFQYVFLSRLGQMLVEGHRGAYPGSPALSALWGKVGWPLMAVAFKAVEALFALQYRNLWGATSPFLKVDIVDDFYGYAQVLDYNLRDMVKSHRIDWKMGEAVRLQPGNKLQLKSGQIIDADVIICGTGFGKDYSVFTEDVRSKLDIQNDGLYLYRHTLPSSVKNLAFVGSELACISNLSSYGLQAAWLAKAWSGETRVPPEADMKAETETVKSWKRSWMPETSSRASLVLLHQIHFHDLLLKDMGLSHRRKGNPFAEFLMPYESADYNNVIGV